jgi:hypothetical protein
MSLAHLSVIRKRSLQMTCGAFRTILILDGGLLEDLKLAWNRGFRRVKLHVDASVANGD